jgi:hypothetical protein
VNPPVRESFRFLPHPPDPPPYLSNRPAPPRPARETRSLHSPAPPAGSSAPFLPFPTAQGWGDLRSGAPPTLTEVAAAGRVTSGPHGGRGTGHSGGTGFRRPPWPRLRVGASPASMARPRNEAHAASMGADAASRHGPAPPAPSAPSAGTIPPSPP